MKLQDFKRIDFNGLPNTRDLGGLKTKDGQRIASKKLLRSGTLSPATDQDAQRLVEDYALNMVIDLRTEEEKKGNPDPFELFPNVRFTEIPLLQTESLGITRGTSKMDMLKELEGLMENPVEIMVAIYPKIVLGADSQKGIQQFFEELLAAEKGSVLWHCSAGKDRVGLTTALLLTVLGVPQEIIVGDYLATNRYLTSHTQGSLEKIPQLMQSEHMREALQVMSSVDIRFLQSALDAVNATYGNVEQYLKDAIGIDGDATKALRQKYLTA